MPGPIFLCYRRSDTGPMVDRLRDHLTRILGDDAVFRDVGGIPAGGEVTRTIHEVIDASSVLLVMIGPRWLEGRDDKSDPRLWESDDFVRAEVERGLAREPALRVIPMLVDGATMPQPGHLPPSIRAIVDRNALGLRRDPDFVRDVEALCEALDVSPRRRWRLATILLAAAVPALLLVAGRFEAVRLGCAPPPPGQRDAGGRWAICEELATTAGKLSAAVDDRAAFAAAEREFNTLYFGKAMLVADQPLKDKLMVLHQELHDYAEHQSSADRVRIRCLELVKACRDPEAARGGAR